MDSKTSLVDEITVLEEALFIAQSRARSYDDEKTVIEQQHENLIQEFESYKKNMKDFIEILTKKLKSKEELTILNDWLKDFEKETNFLKEPNESIFESAEELKLIIENRINYHLENSIILEEEERKKNTTTSQQQQQPFTLTEKLINLKRNLEVFISGMLSNNFFKFSLKQKKKV